MHLVTLHYVIAKLGDNLRHINLGGIHVTNVVEGETLPVNIDRILEVCINLVP